VPTLLIRLRSTRAQLEESADDRDENLHLLLQEHRSPETPTFEFPVAVRLPPSYRDLDADSMITIIQLQDTEDEYKQDVPEQERKKESLKRKEESDGLSEVEKYELSRIEAELASTSELVANIGKLKGRHRESRGKTSTNARTGSREGESGVTNQEIEN